MSTTDSIVMYKTMYRLVQDYNWSWSDLWMMNPFELDVIIIMLEQDIIKERERLEKQKHK